MISKIEIKYFCGLGLLFVIVGITLHFADLTLLNVDQISCRGYYPWKAVNYKEGCNAERDGDYIFEQTFIASELDYLESNPHQNSYTERVMNGYPIASAYSANQYSLTRLLNNFLPITSSANFVAFFYIFVSFLVGYLIAHSLKFLVWQKVLFGSLFITSSYVLLNEAFNLALIGFELVALGILQFYIYDRKKTFAILTLLGAMCIMLSAVFQFYLYTAIFFLLLFTASFFVKDTGKLFKIIFVTSTIFVSGALMLNHFLINHASFLSVSSKINTDIPFSEILKRKDYAFDPLGWIGYEPVQMHRKVASIIFGEKFGYEDYGSVTIGVINSPGLVFFILFFIGAIYFWKKSKGHQIYILLTLFWLFYAAGYLQLLLSLIIGNPFREETSIRAFNLFFLLATPAVIYALGLLTSKQLATSKWMRVAIIFLIYLSLLLPIFIVFRYLKHGQLLKESIYITISCLLFLLYLYLSKKQTLKKWQQQILLPLLIISLILPIFSRWFLDSNPDVLLINKSKLYYPETTFTKGATKYPIKRVALIETLESGRLVHPNSPIMFGLPSLTGYRNPMYKDYSDFYRYHQIIFESESNYQSNYKKSFDMLKRSGAYLNNDLPAIKAPNLDLTPPQTTIRFFDLTQTNTIIGPKDLVIKNVGWQKVVEADNLSLWLSKKPVFEFLLVQKEIVLPNKEDQLEYIFNDPNWNLKETAITNKSVLKNKEKLKNKNIKMELLEKADGYRLFEVTKLDSSAILVLPVTYDKHWKVVKKTRSGLTNLETFPANFAFLGILVPEGTGKIEILYNDKPNKMNNLLFWVGICIFLSILATLTFGQYTRNYEKI